jgi:hypothetical protein
VTSSWSGQRVAATRARSASSSAPGVTGIVNGRIAVASAGFSVVADIWNSLLHGCDYDTKPAPLVSTSRRWNTLGLLPGLLTGVFPGAILESEGASLASIVHWSIAVVDGHALDEGVAAFQQAWNPADPPPAITVHVVAGLGPGLLVEIDAIAVL